MLEDRRIVVVGATGGIGLAVVEELVRARARVLGTGRDPARLGAVEELGAAAQALDLSDPAGPGLLRSEVRARFDDVLDGLVVAAGSLGPIGPTRGLDLDQAAAAFREQTLGSLAIVQACATALDAGRAPSVVLFSGGGATSSFPRYTAYALAKVALVRLVENLAEEEPEWKVNAVAPGFVATSIHDATFAAGPGVAGPYAEETRRRMADAAPPSAAAELVAFLLADESNGITGRLISAVWDDWRGETVQAQLRESGSFGRLRRIDGQQFHEQ